MLILLILPKNLPTTALETSFSSIRRLDALVLHVVEVMELLGLALDVCEVASVWRDVAPIRIETSIEPLAELELVRIQIPFEDCRLARRPSTKDDRLVRLSRQYRVNPRRDFILTCLHF